jgi:hypothetical protein
MKKKRTGLILGIIGFILMLPMVIIAFVAQGLLKKAGADDAGLIVFLLVNLPALAGFIAAFFTRKFPVAAGTIMLVAGLLILIPGVVFGTILFGAITGLLYAIGGGIVLHQSTKFPK